MSRFYIQVRVEQKKVCLQLKSLLLGCNRFYSKAVFISATGLLNYLCGKK